MLTKELKSLIDKYCMGKEPTDAQLDQIMDLAISLNADSLEVANYIEEKQKRKQSAKPKRKPNAKPKKKPYAKPKKKSNVKPKRR